MSSPRQILNDLNALVNSPLQGESRDRLQQICERHVQLQIDSESRSTSFIIQPYKGNNPHVQGLQNTLGKAHGIAHIILQGSLATDEELPYSDFDALVVIEDLIFKEPKLLMGVVVKLQLLSRFMFLHDPLQHHGWFVTTEKLLGHHLDDFFPAVIFNHSRSLFPRKEVQLELRLIKDTSAFQYHLKNTIDSIEREVNSGRYLKSLYELKSTLSKFMLLPALYVQVKSGEGVYKKYSFELARADFNSDEWKVMEEVSEIRKSWNQGMAGWRKWLITAHPSWSRKVAKRISPKVHKELRENVEDKSTKMLTFAQLMLERVKANNG